MTILKYHWPSVPQGVVFSQNATVNTGFAPYKVIYGAKTQLLPNICSPKNGEVEEVAAQDILEENYQNSY